MNFKNKLFGVALAASMMTGAVVPVMAASITIQNPVVNESGEANTYTAYRIFDVVHSGDGYAYTIDKVSPWITVVQDYIQNGTSNVGTNPDNRGVTLSDAPGNPNIKVVEFDKIEFDIAEFATHLNNRIPNVLGEGYEGKSGSLEEGKYVIPGLDDGYYLVSTLGGSLAELITSTSNVEIADKNEQTLTKTIKDGHNTFAAVGDEITYQIKTAVPYATYRPDSTYKIVVTDDLVDSLTLLKDENDDYDISVKIGNHPVAPSFAVSATPMNNPSSGGVEPEEITDYFQVVIDIPNNNTYKVGEEIVIEYKAKVNNNFKEITADAEINEGETNKAFATINGQYVEDFATFYTASARVEKTDASTDAPLRGAVFTLKNGNKYYSVVDGNISWVDSQTDLSQMDTDDQGNLVSTGTNFVTDADGFIKFDGLDADVNYTLTEIKAPDGYNLMKGTETIDFSVVDGSSLVLQSVPVENYKGMQLPETGGMGTTLFYMVGGTLVAGGAVLLITKKRMSEAE